MHALGETPQGVTFPTVIYMHGCAGFWAGTDRRLNMLARHGFATIAPDSFARAHKPVSCDTSAHRGGLHRGGLGMRLSEARHAFRKARELDWVDTENLFLMGLSEGGITVARLSEDLPPVNARVIEGWTCHAGWPEYRGLSSYEGQPVLSLVSAEDPWFQSHRTRGHCGAFMRNRRAAGSRSEAPFDALTHARRLPGGRRFRSASGLAFRSPARRAAFAEGVVTKADLRAEAAHLEARMVGLETRMDSLEAKFDMKIGTLQWAFGFIALLTRRWRHACSASPNPAAGPRWP